MIKTTYKIKTIVKYIFLFLSTFFGGTYHAAAQDDCRIWYDYDAAGQRVKRYYRCIEPGGINQPPDRVINVTVFPNPTDGPVIVVVNESVDEMSATLRTIDGALISNVSCTNCTDLNLSLAGHPAGSYVLQVSATKVDYPDLNEGHTIILRYD